LKHIALLGHGVVGSGVHELFHKNRESINEKLGEEVIISKILVRNLSKYSEEPEFKKFTDTFTSDFYADVDFVIEVMGSISPAYEYVKKALEAGKHVITANKDLIAEKGEELSKIATANNAVLNFEASVAGGIPIIKTVKESLAGNTIDRITAILNGTTNFILSKMYEDDMDYDTALKLAQEAGFAEANPTSDVMGYDAARKLSILTRLAFDKVIPWKKISIQGITGVDRRDIQFAKSQKYKIKLVATSFYNGSHIYATVQPAFVHRSSVIGKIDNEFNTVVINGDAVGEIVFSGKGAGRLPTASAILGDLMDIIINKKKTSSGQLAEKCEMMNYWPFECNWFVRLKSKGDPISIDNIFNCFDQSEVQIKDLKDLTDVGFIVKAQDEKYIKDRVMDFLAHNTNLSIKYYKIFEDVMK